ncbi:chondroitinase family protein [Streptomyces sp. NBC_01618]|uniref:chondroitinase family protein n=1 Tax=Streptomyces sp. NBC_01618 TaxID=2975900 RepID=UPI00386A284A|nr:hypothetical protein OH735_36805 [Streptomyces sp. NBC_01618]
MPDQPRGFTARKVLTVAALGSAAAGLPSAATPAAAEPAEDRCPIRAPTHYKHSTSRPGDDQAYMRTVDTFAVWIHNDRPLDDVLRVEFGRGRNVDAWCEIHLGFTGWRTAWIRYGYDLSGTPHRS